MKILIFVLFLLPSTVRSQTQAIPLPNVEQEARKAINLIKDHSPVAGCIRPEMFSSVSPLNSSKQMGQCVKQKISNLDISQKTDQATDSLSNLKNSTQSEFQRIFNCFSSSSSFQDLTNCF